MGEVVRVSHGLWRPVEAVDDLGGRCAALLSRLPPGAVIAGETAARLHGLWLPERGEAAAVEIVVGRGVEQPRTLAHSRRREVRARRRHLDEDEVVWHAGVPVTSLARTWADLGECLALPDLVAAADSAVRAGTFVELLRCAVARAVHRPGVRNARAALEFVDGRSRSRPESLLRVGLIQGGLPAPAVNAPVFDAAGQWVAEPDLSYRDARLAIEYNGAGHADVRRMRRDITRELDLLDRAGWQVVTVGPTEVFRRLDATVLLIGEVRRRRLGT